MTRCYAYSRVSGTSQLDGDGFERQRAAIETYAAANDLKILRWFEERAISGKTEWEDRPAWVEMITAMNGVHAVVIERLDRLARDLGVQEHIIRDLKARNIALISTAEPDLGSSDPTRVLFRQIMGSISQFDRAMIEAKLRAARNRMKKKTGRCEGRYPYAHDPERPQEAEVLALMLRWRAEQYNYTEIAQKLNAAHISTRDSGGKWFQATVSRIIRREQARES